MFPTVIYQYKIQGHEEWKPLLLSKKEHQFDPNDGDPHLTGEYRGKCLLHKDESLMSFFAEMQSVINECLDAAEIKTEIVTPYFMKSWFTIKNKSDQLSEHTHACSDLSFVYYLEDSTILFRQEDNRNEYFGGVYHPKSEERSLIRGTNFYNSNFVSLAVEEGDVLVFPSNLPHMVLPDDGDEVVIRSIAGDIKLVLNDECTNLETGLIHFNHWRSF